MKLSGIKVLEKESGAVTNRTQRPQSETIAVNVYVGNGRRWSEGNVLHTKVAYLVGFEFKFSVGKTSEIIK